MNDASCGPGGGGGGEGVGGGEGAIKPLFLAVLLQISTHFDANE